MSYYNLESLIDHFKFNDLQEEIHIGLVETLPMAVCGDYQNTIIDYSPANIPPGFRTLKQAYADFLKLSDEDPIKQTGLVLQQENSSYFSAYLKIALQAYDPFYYHTLWKDGVEVEQTMQYFPQTKQWILDSCMPLFEHLNSITFIVCEANGLGWEQQSQQQYKDFLYIRSCLEKPMYVWSNNTKIYIDSKVAFWNQDSCIGHEKITKQTYALRIDGTFKSQIKEQYV
jgi:hypothetical protein